jgi:hypothetical protein
MYIKLSTLYLQIYEQLKQPTYSETSRIKQSEIPPNAPAPAASLGARSWIRPAREPSVDSGRPLHKGGAQQASGTDPGSLAASDPNRSVS